MIKTRFAPSPTGYLHIGSLRTALYAYLFAKQNNGHFILRIEDTDQTRFVEGAVENLIETLIWAGLTYDEGPNPNNPEEMIGDNGPYIQSKRYDLYQEHAEKLMNDGYAYRCFCTRERLDHMRTEQQKAKQAPMYDKHCLTRPQEEKDQLIQDDIPYVVRLNIPRDQKITFTDAVRGDMEFEGHTIDDQVLIKSDGFPTYHLANVVDDHYMEITHVIRGEEWLPSTPKHVVLYQAFGWEPPTFAHIPLLLNKDRSKLSKRQNDVAVGDYIEKGYLKPALLNYIALLGWHPGSGETEEYFTVDQLIEKFSLTKVHKSGAVFDVDRLNNFNAHYIRQLSPEAFADAIYPWLEKANWWTGTRDDLSTPAATRIMPAIQTRIILLPEALDMLSYLLTDELKYDLSLLENEKMGVDKSIAKNSLEAALNDLKNHDNFDDPAALKECVVSTIQKLEVKNGIVMWPLRAALTGVPKSPGAFEMMQLLGKERSLKRLQQTLDRL